MTDPEKRADDEVEIDQEVAEDLEVEQGDAAKVTGGRKLRGSGDPCEGGEVAAP